MTGFDQQSTRLSVLSQAPAATVKQYADDLLPALGPIEVLQNRTGLVMLPAADTVAGTQFYLGEVLLAEAHVRLGGAEGYGACLGRDLEQALAIAILDAAASAGVEHAAVAAFVEQQQAALDDADTLLLRQVESTRVEMETF